MTCVLAVVMAAPAAALEQDPTYAYGPSTPFYFPGQDAATARTAGLPPTAAGGGVDVLGDSISVGVPYVERAAEDGVSASVRSVFGWTVRLHRRVTGWTGTPATSVETVMSGDAAAVVVELGTNDLRCLRPSDSCPDTPAADAPGAEAFVDAGRAAIADEVSTLATELLAADKCVVWAGPRVAPGLEARDVAFFAGLLDDLQDAHPDRFHRIDLDANPTVAADFADPASDGVHPRSNAARSAIADVLITVAERRCHLSAAGGQASIDTGPPKAGTGRTPSFAFSARQRRTTFTCRLDDGPATACASPVTLPPQADGRHRFAVTATNAAGGSDPAPATRVFVVDTTGPELRFEAPARLARSATPVLAFAATTGDATAWACRVDSGPPVPCSSPFTAGSLPDGVHVVSVGAQDALGNAGPPVSAAFRIDTLAPRVGSGPADVRVDRRGHGRLVLRCADAGGRCAGTLVVRSAFPLGTGARRHPVTFARTTFAVRDGAGRSVPFTINAAGMLTLPRRGAVQVRATVTATDAAGNRSRTISGHTLRTTSR